MINKKAEEKILLPNTLSFLLALLGLALVFGGAAYLLHQYTPNIETENAKSIITSLQKKIETLPKDSSNTFTFQGVHPNSIWKITSFGKTNKERPARCFFNSCICIYKGSSFNNADLSKTFCRKVQEPTIEVKDYTDPISSPDCTIGITALSRGVPEKETCIFEEITFPKNLIEIQISKETNKVSLTHYSQGYLDKQKTKESATEKPKPLYKENLLSKSIIIKLSNNDNVELSVLNAYKEYENNNLEKSTLSEALKSLVNEKTSCLALAKGPTKSPAGKTGSQALDDLFLQLQSDSSILVSHTGNTPLILAQYKNENLLEETTFINNKEETIYVESYLGDCI